VDLVQRLVAGEGEFLLFAITPAKAATGTDDLRRIAELTLSRLRALNPAGVVLYDILEERDRNPETRPVPFLPTLDPAEYLTHYLSAWDKPAVGKYPEPQLQASMQRQSPDRIATVLVGASSSQHPGLTSLPKAHALLRQMQPDLIVGAVAIPERHAARGDEHRRMLDKEAGGCAFFISQVLYDADAAKNLVSDYRDECDARAVEP